MIPKLHVVTDDDVLQQEAFPRIALKVLAAGGPNLALHVRGPRTNGRRLLRLVEALQRPAVESGATLIVNDRVDVALCTNPQGVHLGQRSLPAHAARRLVGLEPILGLSVHGPGEIPPDGDEVLDYLVVGTIFPSRSHPGGTPGGIERIREVRESTRLPLVGIGGLTHDRVGDVLAAGAYGAALLGAVWGAPDPAVAVAELLAALQEGTET